MSRLKNVLWISVATLALTAVTSEFASSALAQVRAALVRNVDTPALQPFRGIVDYNFTSLNDQRLITTVPAGKRLAIENISWNAGNPSSQQIVFAGLRTSQFGLFVQHIEINPPHTAATSGLVLQDGSSNVTLYFEPGEEVWISASKSSGAASANLHVNMHSYFVTL